MYAIKWMRARALFSTFSYARSGAIAVARA